ncbi:MAG: methyltransferase domain-containing protein [Candidatus Aenigmarchaeota archaeon]|nr:methyltransferase domain-containing protein [Candidatus Aenigmarchaeota archaeon]NIP40238.1 methyltransferase domain-containing protein [Candidatus Aenigmarchaeota archaeon]NIQ17503.1 methyltransferase domain-containing protein [Candidatus Aenigmarchaeota archaeon]
MDIVEEEIREFLKRNGIECLAKSEELWEKAKERLGEKAVEGIGPEEFISKRYFLVNQNLKFYDIFECRYDRYELNVSLLKDLVGFMDSPECEFLVSVIDSGCGTGNHICFLAKKYGDRKHEFWGYDRENGMITIANEKKERMDLNNVKFYVSGHDEPMFYEKEFADLLYNMGALYLRREMKPEDIAERIRNIFLRVKPGGTGILGPIESPHFYKNISDILEDYGIGYEGARKVQEMNEPWYVRGGLYNHYFRIGEDGR